MSKRSFFSRYQGEVRWFLFFAAIASITFFLSGESAFRVKRPAEIDWNDPDAFKKALKQGIK